MSCKFVEGLLCLDLSCHFWCCNSTIIWRHYDTHWAINGLCIKILFFSCKINLFTTISFIFSTKKNFPKGDNHAQFWYVFAGKTESYCIHGGFPEYFPEIKNDTTYIYNYDSYYIYSSVMILLYQLIKK